MLSVSTSVHVSNLAERFKGLPLLSRKAVCIIAETHEAIGTFVGICGSTVRESDLIVLGLGSKDQFRYREGRVSQEGTSQI